MVLQKQLAQSTKQSTLSDKGEFKLETLRIERQPTTLRSLVANKLRDAIVEGVFRPGERLIERDICQRLDISRPSVREAIRQLEAEGLIDLVPHRGPTVRNLQPRQAADLYDIMSVLEGQCASHCATRATEGDLIVLREGTERLIAALLARDTQSIVRSKKLYYDALLTACHNPDLEHYLRQISARLSQFWSTSIHVPGRVKEGVAELRAILTAIERRDPDGAFAAAMTFIQHARRPHVPVPSAGVEAARPPAPLPRPAQVARQSAQPRQRRRTGE